MGLSALKTDARTTNTPPAWVEWLLLLTWKKVLLLCVVTLVSTVSAIGVANELAWLFASKEVKANEVVEVLPGYMYQQREKGPWTMEIAAVVYRPCAADFLRKNLLSATSKVASIFGFDATIAHDRFDAFFRDLKRGKMISVWPSVEPRGESLLDECSSSTTDSNAFKYGLNIGDALSVDNPHTCLLKVDDSATYTQGCIDIGPSSTGGIILSNLTISDSKLSSQANGLWLNVARPQSFSQSNDFPPRFMRKINYSGMTIISDIDDTIKVTEIFSVTRLLRNTLLTPFVSVPNMAVVYQRWAAESIENPAFHYVSSSPWPMATLLHSWIVQAGIATSLTSLPPPSFPDGSLHLKAFRFEPFELWGIDATALNLLRNPFHYKVQRIVNIVTQFPGRQFVLVGDSGEKDPEVYSNVAKMFPEQIRCIYIRNIDAKPLAGERLLEVQYGLTATQMIAFEDPFEPPTLSDIRNNGIC
jgi:hypothetical protein